MDSRTEAAIDVVRTVLVHRLREQRESGEDNVLFGTTLRVTVPPAGA